MRIRGTVSFAARVVLSLSVLAGAWACGEEEVVDPPDAQSNAGADRTTPRDGGAAPIDSGEGPDAGDGLDSGGDSDLGGDSDAGAADDARVPGDGGRMRDGGRGDGGRMDGGRMDGGGGRTDGGGRMDGGRLDATPNPDATPDPDATPNADATPDPDATPNADAAPALDSGVLDAAAPRDGGGTPVPPDPSGAVELTAHDYPTGDGPADLLSTGVPFQPGELTDVRGFRIVDGAVEVQIAAQVLARWPTDNSIRAVLVQVRAPFAGATKRFVMEVGTTRSLADDVVTPVTWRFPRKIATLPAAYLARSLVMWEQKPHGMSGFPAWEQKAVNSFSRINTEPNPSVPCARTDQYYDTANTSYALYARTGELQYLVNARRWAYHHGRHQIYLTGTNVGHGICTGGYVNNTRYTFVDSLVRDHWLWGDPESLRVAGLVVDNFYMPHASSWYYKAPNTRGFWTEREAAFAQLGLVAYYEATLDASYLDRARTRVYSLHQMQVDNGRRAWVHNLYDHDPSEGCGVSDYGSSSFMSGLLLESLIRFHKLTCDPRAAESITMAIDDLRQRNVATGAYAGESLIYLGCPQTNTDYRDGVPDLDNLAAHAWAYAYRMGGFSRTDYRDFGTALFNTSVTDGFVGAAKQYNQAFRDSGNFVGYLDRSVRSLLVCGP